MTLVQPVFGRGGTAGFDNTIEKKFYVCGITRAVVTPSYTGPERAQPTPAGQPKKQSQQMKKSTRLLVTAAAMAGLYAGALTAKTYAADEKAGTSDKAKSDAKHDCKGKNACKGQGGCKAGDNGCKGKNSCKGHGGCSTAEKTEAKKEEKK